MRRSTNSIFTAGLTNRESEDYGEFATAKPRKKPKAFCTSDKCCFYRREIVKIDHLGECHVGYKTCRIKEKQKDVSEMTKDCPDCGSSLLWKVVNDA